MPSFWLQSFFSTFWGVSRAKMTSKIIVSGAVCGVMMQPLWSHDVHQWAHNLFVHACICCVQLVNDPFGFYEKEICAHNSSIRASMWSSSILSWSSSNPSSSSSSSSPCCCFLLPTVSVLLLLLLQPFPLLCPMDTMNREPSWLHSSTITSIKQ